MANRLSDQEALEFQFQGNPVDPVYVEEMAQFLRKDILESIEYNAEVEAYRHKKRCEIYPDLPQCFRTPPPLTMEEYHETIKDIFEGNQKFDQLLEDTEEQILVDPVDDFFLGDGPVEHYEPWANALIPTLIVTIILGAIFLFARDGIRRLLGRPKQKTGKWGIY